MRKAIIRSILTLVLIVAFSHQDEAQSAGPILWGKKGTAAVTNATLTPPFFPTTLCIKNEDATNGIYIDWSDGVASTVDNSTNLYIQPGQLYCYEFNQRSSPSRDIQIGIIAVAATPAYHIHAYRFN